MLGEPTRADSKLMKGESVCKVPDMCAIRLDIISARVFTERARRAPSERKARRLAALFQRAFMKDWRRKKNPKAARLVDKLLKFQANKGISSKSV